MLKNLLAKLEPYRADIEAAAEFIALNAKEGLEIYCDDMEKFRTLFFAALLCDMRPILLRDARFNEEFYLNDDSEISNFTTKNFNLDLLNPQAKFYIKTSGSTGEPKLIEKSLAMMVSEGEFLRVELDVSEETRLFSSISHQLMFGLTFKFFLPLLSGARASKGELNYPEIIFAQDLHNAILITSPTILEAICKHANARKIAPLRAIISAGAKLSDELRARLNKLGSAQIIDIYGSSESGVIARNFGDGLMKFEPVQISVEDENFIINSPWCENYHSSDYGEIHGSQITLLGRSDRIVKIAENRMSLDAIERTIGKHEFVKSACAGIHPGNKNRILALIVLSKAGENEFRAHGKKSIVTALKSLLKDDFKSIVRYFKIVSRTPANAQGKITKEAFVRVTWTYEMPEFREISHGKFSAKILPSDFYFDGHFADFPLVPAFMQLRFVKICAAKMGYDLNHATKIENLKFTNFIRPMDEITISLSEVNAKIRFEISHEKVCSSGKISL